MSKRSRAMTDSRPKGEPLPSFLASRWAIVLAGGIVIFAALAAYHGCFSVPFLLDDKLAITENPTIRHLWPIGSVLSPPAGGLTVSGRPVVNLSLAANYAVGGMSVWGYHAVNLTIHVLACLTLLGIVRRTLLLDAGLRDRYGPMALPLAMAVALLWGLHPLQTESVTYLVQRAESLMGLFYLLTLYCFIRGLESAGRGWFALAVVACGLGMGTKEVMISAPLLVWLYDRTFVAGTFGRALRARWRVYAGLGGCWAVLGYLVVRTGELGSERAGFQTVVTWWQYGLTQLWAVWHYLRLSVWPHPLVFDYGTMVMTRGTQMVLGAVMTAGLAIGTVASLRWRPRLGFVGCWFFAILAPTSSVVTLVGQTVAEHRMYLSLAAVVSVVVLGAYAWMGRRSLVLLPALAVVAGLLASRRNEDYRSEVALWTDTVAKRPDNPRAHDSLGTALFHQGRVPEAMGCYEQALRLKLDYAIPHCNLGNALLQQGRVPEAMDHYEQALSINPDYAEAHNNLGAALFRLGRVPEAISHYQQAVRIKPDYAIAHYNVGNAMLQKGQVLEAIGQMERAVQLKPDFAEARNRLAWVLATCADGSVRNGAQAVELAEGTNKLAGGEEATILDTLAAAYAEAGRFGDAMRMALKAIELAQRAGQTELTRQIQERLQLYQAGRPYHEGTAP